MRKLFILFLLFTPLLYASQFANPYQGNIVVAEQNEDMLKELALKQVLVKVSGNAQIAEFNESKLLLENPDSLLSQYGYQTLLNRRYFTAVFDKQQINQALIDMQQPVWGETRPTTLVWLINDSGNVRQLVSDHMVSQDNDKEIASLFLQQQHNRGISLQFPLMDLEDRLALSISDVSGRFYKPITRASMRYGVEHLVVADLQQLSADKYSLSWQLVKSESSGRQSKVLVSDRLRGEKATLITAMVNKIADYYASQYAILENQGEKFSQTIYVDGINSLAQLTQLSSVLESLVAIASFEIVSVKDSLVAVEIKINGGLNSFKNGLFAQPNLQPDLSQSETFHFNWR
jgi:hypothetical protein